MGNTDYMHLGFWWSHRGKRGEKISFPPKYDPAKDQVVEIPLCDYDQRVETWLCRWENGKTYLGVGAAIFAPAVMPRVWRMGNTCETSIGPVVPIDFNYNHRYVVVTRANWLYPLWRIWLPIRRVGRFCAGLWRVNLEYARHGGWR